MRLPMLTVCGLAALTIATLGLTADVQAKQVLGCGAPLARVVRCAGRIPAALTSGHRARKARRQLRRAERAAVSCAAPVGCGG